MINPDNFESFSWLSEYSDQGFTDSYHELPLHMKFRPHLNNLYFEDENLSADSKVIFERISLHYLKQIALLTDTLKKLGVDVFYGTHIDDPDEEFIFFCCFSEAMQEFVDQEDIKII